MKRHVYAVLGRPGTEAAMVARLLGARLNEVVSVPSAATAEVEHSTHLGKRLQGRQLWDRRRFLSCPQALSRW